MNIDVVGSIDGGNHFSKEVVADLLSGHEIHMVHGAEYTGKPGTLLHVTDEHVLKLKTEKTLSPEFCRKWIEKILAKEREYGVAMPEKTWIVVEKDGQAIPGNITPKIQPIHLIVQDDTKPVESKVALINRVLEIYISFSSRGEAKLDEGLSNFGVDAANRLWYLDDDFYSWDDYNGLSQMLGVFIRSYAWLDVEAVSAVAQSLKASILAAHHQDYHHLYVLSEQLGYVFQPPEKKDVFKVLREGLIKRDNHATRKPDKIDNREIAFIGDIHANLLALEAVIRAIESQGIDRVIVLGDIVGYGPHPNECISLIREKGYEALMGNHDHAISHQLVDERFTKTARWSAEWTIARLEEDNRRWLSMLPPIIHGDAFMAVHGAPIDPTFFNAYVYARTFMKNLEYMIKNGIKRCFHGHTHIPGIYAMKREGVVEIDGSGEVNLSRVDAALVCPGSVGHPRSGIREATYVSYCEGDDVVTYHQAEYSLHALIAEMQKKQFPDFVMDSYIKAA